MPLVTYTEAGGGSRAIDVPDGYSVMEAALDNGIGGIVGECGGGLACATCHCYVDEAWIDRVGAAQGAEVEMLECAASPAKPNSRLSCQIVIDETLDGLVVHLPEAQL